ncbi:MAG TPA: hypothetical protein PK413_03105 [Thermoanaerobaculia bacterium]|nr:hypothetical protein [Thermoanaerobaculia bacterium]
MEAKVARGLGRPAEAEKLYLQVQSMFAAGGQAFQAALAGLELSLLQVEQGRMVEARKLAAEIVPAFLAQDIRREALAAVLVYEDAARREVLTTAVVHETLRALSRAPFAAASA